MILSAVLFTFFMLILVVFLPVRQLDGSRNLRRMVRKLDPQADMVLVEHRFSGAVAFFERIYRLFPFQRVRDKAQKIQARLKVSGISDTITGEAVFGFQVLLSMFCFFYLLFLSANLQSGLLYLFALLFAYYGYVYPGMYIESKIKTRREKIASELPVFLNSLHILTDAGLGLQDAIRRIVDVRKGLLPDLLNRALEETETGFLFKEAMIRVTERCELQELDATVSTMIQNMQRGTSGLSAVLKDQAAQIWAARETRARELGAKASMKLFMPMLLMVFPAMMIVLLGPAVIMIVDLLKGGL